MSKSLKATLFSALVFPGSGHFFLKKYYRAALLAGISVACIYVLMSTAIAAAQQISDKIISGEIPLDVTRITQAVSTQAASSGTQLTDIATYGFLLCWLVGIVDAYRLGRLLDRAANPPA